MDPEDFLPYKWAKIIEKMYCVTCCIITFGIFVFFAFIYREPKPTNVPADVVKLIPELIEHMKWSYKEKILDYGSGRGEVEYFLILPETMMHNSEVYSVEFQQSNVKYAMENFANSWVQYAVGNIYSENRTEFPYWNIKFDKIFAIDVFQFVPNLDKLLNRFKEVLKPGGQVAFTTTTVNNLFVEINLRLSESPKWKNFTQRYKEKYYPAWSNLITKLGEDPETEIRSMFKKAGFRVVYLKLRTTKYKTQSIDASVDALMWQTPVYQGIPDTKIEDLKDDIRKLFINITGLAPRPKKFYIQNERILGVLERI